MRPVLADLDQIPAVCFLEDLAYWLQTSKRTLERLQRANAIPIAELPSLDKRHRWSGQAVRRYLELGHRTNLRRSA